jgi:hypothetical protein
VGALSGCLQDYNLSIKLAALENLCVLCSAADGSPVVGIGSVPPGSSGMGGLGDGDADDAGEASGDWDDSGDQQQPLHKSIALPTSLHTSAATLGSELRKCGVLDHVVRLLKAFPAEDTTLQGLCVRLLFSVKPRVRS